MHVAKAGQIVFLPTASAIQFLPKSRHICDIAACNTLPGLGERVGLLAQTPRHGRNALVLRQGDVVDFWRVETIEPNRLLRLHAEMRLPGRAWLEFEVSGDARGSLIRQTAIFDPVGILGLIYWYALYPIHRLVFAGMLKALARAAEKQTNEASA